MLASVVYNYNIIIYKVLYFCDFIFDPQNIVSMIPTFYITHTWKSSWLHENILIYTNIYSYHLSRDNDVWTGHGS